MPNEFSVIVLRTINNSRFKLIEKKLKRDATTFRFKYQDRNGTFKIPNDITCAYIDNGKAYLFFDFDSGLLDFKEGKFPLSITEMDDFISVNIIAGIFNRIRGTLEKEGISGAILKYLAVAGICLLGGGILGYILHSPATPVTTTTGVPTAMIMELLKWHI